MRGCLFLNAKMYPLNWTKFKGKSWKLDYSMRVNPTNCTYPKNHVKFIIVAIYTAFGATAPRAVYLNGNSSSGS